MTVPLYTRDFWDRALWLVDQPQVCEQCARVHIVRKVDSVRVRVVLTGNSSPAPNNLRLLCQQCYPNPVPVKFSRKHILAQIAEVPFPEPDKAKTVNAR